MKILILLLTVFVTVGTAQKFEYAVYETFAEFKNKKFIQCALINENGERVSYDCDKDSSKARAKMLKKHVNWKIKKYPKANSMDVLSIMGQRGWELVNITGKPDSSNKK